MSTDGPEPSTVASPGKTPERSEWRRGGRTALSAMLGFGAGPVMLLTTASVFVRPMMEATGWSTTEVLIAPILNIVMACVGPLAGRLVDRRGTRLTLTVGLLPFVALLVLFALLPFSRLTFYGMAALIGLFGSFAYTVPYNRAVALWFDKGAGKAFGLVGAGAALMPFAIIPVLAWVVYTFGWQRGYLVLAVFALVIAIPAALWGVQHGGPQGAAGRDAAAVAPVAEGSAVPTAAGGADASAVVRTGRFWVFALSVLLVSGATGAFLSNIQPILLDGGLGVVLATTVTTVYSVGGIAGRFVGGVLLDLYPRYRVAPAVLAASGLGALALTGVNVLPFAVVILAALLVSFSQGAEGDFVSYFILKEYGRAHFGRLFSYVYVMTGVGALLGSYAFGITRDLTGGYTVACIVAACCFVAGAATMVLFGMLGRRDVQRDADDRRASDAPVSTGSST